MKTSKRFLAVGLAILGIGLLSQNAPSFSTYFLHSETVIIQQTAEDTALELFDEMLLSLSPRSPPIVPASTVVATRHEIAP